MHPDPIRTRSAAHRQRKSNKEPTASVSPASALVVMLFSPAKQPTTTDSPLATGTNEGAPKWGGGGWVDGGPSTAVHFVAPLATVNFEQEQGKQASKQPPEPTAAPCLVLAPFPMGLAEICFPPLRPKEATPSTMLASQASSGYLTHL